MMDWTWLALLIFVLGMTIGLAEILRQKYQWSIETTRKIVHIFTGILIALSVYLLHSSTPLLIISGVFVLINFFAIRKGWMPGMHDSAQKSYGTFFYPLSFFILILLLWNGNKTILILSMWIMAIADGVAALVGQNVRSPKLYKISGEQKSLQGSQAMFLVTFLIVIFGLKIFAVAFNEYQVAWLHALWYGLIVALIATACESLSYRGSDNLSVPLGAAFFLYFLVNHSNSANMALTLGVGLALFIALISFYVKFLSGSGSVATFLLGAVVFGVGGWEFSLPLLAFFVLSSLLSKLGKKQKARFADTFQKGGRRDLGQVFANGGVAGILVILWYFFPNDGIYLAFLGSLAAVTADTWGTEIGVFSKIMPRNVINFRQVPPGTSGGVTLLGLFGGLLGSVVIVLAGKAVTASFQSHSLMFPAVIVMAGLFGSLVDSYFGATIQAQFECPNCGKITEKHIHCTNYVTVLHSGLQPIDNDVVNAICALSGAAFAYVAYSLII